jgi:hypothetical protein
MRRIVVTMGGFPRSSSPTSRALVALALALLATCACTGAARAAPGLQVVPLPASGAGLSYFKLSLARGRTAQAGAIELRNPSPRTVRVALAPVAGETIDTLGSTYAPAGAHPGSGGPRGWLKLGARRVTVAPGGRAAVPLSVTTPRRVSPGDFLAGVSIEALDQHTQRVARKGVSIASVVRYAIGVEISVPGPRHPLIRFTGARLQRQPAGLVFLLDARNLGNVILQNVHGRASISRRGHVILSAPLGPGTFVTSSAIEYPLLDQREHPSEGTSYRIRAYLRYAGGIAWLDTTVRFGHAAALVQSAYGRARPGSGLPGWLIALLGLLGATLLGILASLLAWSRRGHSPLRTLDAALAASRAHGTPLCVILVTPAPGRPAGARLARALRARLRHADRLVRIDGGRLLVVCADTDLRTAEALADDLRRHRSGHSAGSEIVALAGDRYESARELLGALAESGAAAPQPLGA